MFVQTRRQDERLLIGNNIELTVKEINSRHIRLSIKDPNDVIVDKLQSKIIADNTKAKVVKTDKTRVKLDIGSLECTTINREGVYMKDQVGNVLSSPSDEIGYTKILMDERIDD